MIGLQRVKCWNNVKVIVNDQCVYKCKITDLDFGGDGEIDHLVQQAEKEILKAY